MFEYITQFLRFVWEALSHLSAEYYMGAAAGAFIIWLLNLIRRKRNRAKWRRLDVTDLKNQKQFIDQVRLFPKKPVNREAYRVFLQIEELLLTSRGGHRIFAEVSMGAFIGTDFGSGSHQQRNRAYSSFGSKRVDFLIINPSGDPVLAIEYHGSGHNQSNFADRDEIKRLVLERAGINLVAIYPQTKATDYCKEIACLIGVEA